MPPWIRGSGKGGRLAETLRRALRPGRRPLPPAPAGLAVRSLAPGPPSRSERLGPAFWLACLWILALSILALAADRLPLPPFDRIDWHHLEAPPGTEGTLATGARGGKTVPARFVYLLGTDTMGRDMATRIIHGARISLPVGLLPPLIGLVIGGFLGLLAGFYRGRAEFWIMVLMDAIFAFPAMVLLLVMTFLFDPGLGNLILAMGLITIPYFTRVARANTLAFAQREFVQCARMLGLGDAAIMAGEILPNIMMPLVVYALLLVSYMIVAEGTLSFLGLGIPVPAPSWGGMIADGKEVLGEAPHISLIPGLVLFVTVLCFNVIGDSVKRVFASRECRL